MAETAAHLVDQVFPPLPVRQWVLAVESARAAGITGIYLEVRVNNQDAPRFYRVLGFQELMLLPRYYGGVEAAVWMARDLRHRTTRHTA